MRTLTLVKVGNNPHVNHLYEHLFCIALRKLFKDAGLLGYVDYHIDGRSYDHGLIHIDIFLFSKAAKKMIPHLHKTKVDVGLETVPGAQLQINAERKRRFSGNVDAVVRQLKKLERQPWQYLNQYGLSGVRRTKRSFKTLQEEGPPIPKTKNLCCEYILEAGFARQEPSLLPLFHILSRAVGNNLSDELCDTHWYYSSGDNFIYTKNSVKRVYKLRTILTYRPQLTDELPIVKALLREMRERRFIEKLADFLGSTRYGVGQGAPDELEQYEDTGIFVGSAGWHKIGNEENVRRLLEHTTLRLVFGKEERYFKVKDLL